MEAKASKKNSKGRSAKNRPKQSQVQLETGTSPSVASQEPKPDVVLSIEADSETATAFETQPQSNHTQQVVEDSILEVDQIPPTQPEAEISTANEEPSRDISIPVEPSSDTPLMVGSQPVDEAHVPSQESAPKLEPSITDDSDDLSLPDNLTRLTTANGAEVYLLGTAHFSHNSVKDVQRVMRTIRPNIVVLELCKERAFMLSLNEADLLEQNKNLTFEKVRSAIAQKGLAQGIIYIMFIKMSASLTEKLGLAPGSEFRAGANEAHKIPGCSIALGDRSLKVTLARAVASATTWQKIKLIYQVLTNDAGMTQEEVEKCKDKGILEQLMKELGVEFPGFKRVILDERNIYLAHSIYHYAQNFEASCGPQRVVAIVGIGHVAGIVEQWGKTTNEDVTRLNEIPEVSKTRRFVSKTFKYCSIALLVYVSYRVIVPSSIQNLVSEKLTKLK